MYVNYTTILIMDFSSSYFEILFNIVRRQNECLLHEIAIRENIPIAELRQFIPSKKNLRTFLRHKASQGHDVSDSQDGTSSPGMNSQPDGLC